MWQAAQDIFDEAMVIDNRKVNWDGFVKRQALLRAAKERRLWRVIFAIFLSDRVHRSRNTKILV